MGINSELVDLLMKPVWTTKDILKYDSTITTMQSAINIKTRAIKEFDGAVPYGKKFVLADAVLKMYGTTRDEELKKLKLLED